MNTNREHALVIGGSMAGLLAARVLSETYARVTIVERDIVGSSVAPRKGVPQGNHFHVLLASGMRAIEQLCPGMRELALARGAREVDIGDFGTLYLRGVRMPRVTTGERSLLMTRPLLEGIVRGLVLARPNVSVREGCSVRGLVGSASLISGVTLDDAEPLPADLVVDASGRGSRLPAWLQALGLSPPREQVVKTPVTYSGCLIRRRPHHLGGEASWVMTPLPPELRFGAAQAVEGDRFIVALTSYLGDPGADTYQGFIDYARSMKLRGLDELLRDSEPVSEIKQMHDPLSRYRRYDELARFPGGLLVIGDAFCNFNPAYGQGMSVAALEALALERCLLEGDARLAQRFFAAASRIIAAPWQLATGADLQWDGVEGERTRTQAWINAYVASVIEAARSDTHVAEKLIRVMHLLAPPSTLFSPSVLFAAWRARRAAVNAPAAVPVVVAGE